MCITGSVYIHGKPITSRHAVYKQQTPQRPSTQSHCSLWVNMSHTRAMLVLAYSRYRYDVALWWTAINEHNMIAHNSKSRAIDDCFKPILMRRTMWSVIIWDWKKYIIGICHSTAEVNKRQSNKTCHEIIASDVSAENSTRTNRLQYWVQLYQWFPKCGPRIPKDPRPLSRGSVDIFLQRIHWIISCFHRAFLKSVTFIGRLMHSIV